ncbi:Tetratricopeptide (TPR) repeat [Micromonospora matsumotoense]|uniref:Tetratricopeptide (TPR) repeat n=1 Tax=Micromonospora matsumotoense TaxID=121616 RepID=A0A1C5AWH7_9ACTN|nr:tetratricopeptide repeat protein [Micromonospora matsumotoense]SCF49533.1 Tetratricopeptide (TPR) repeat [Micromonospora matsumotoense]
MSEAGGAAQQTLAWFAGELRHLRRSCGAPSLNTLVTISTSQGQPLARSTISDKLNARSLPDWSFVLAFVTACLAHADRAGVRLPAELTEMRHWDARHWRLLRIADDARTEDRLRAAAQTQLGHRCGGVALTSRPEPPAPGPSPTRQRAGVLDGVTPRQLPTAVPHLVGRRTALAELDDLLAHRHRSPGTTTICLISGTAGVGKTSLAVSWAHQVAHRFPDGQLYVNLRGFDATGPTASPAEVLREFLEALGVPAQRVPAGQDARSGLFRSVLTGRRVLVLLDNAGDADQVRPLLPGSPECLVVVTGRGHLPGLVTIEGASPLLLDPLSRRDAHELLSRRLGTDRLDNEPEAATRIVDAAAGLPLALAIVAGRAAVQPGLGLGRLADELTGSAGLDRFSHGDAVTDVRTVFSWSYQNLDATSARAFRLLGLHPGPDVSVPALASLVGVPVAEAGRTLVILAGANLVSEHRPQRYVLHDLLHAYAAELVAGHEPAQERRQALGRLIDFYLHTGYAADLLLYDQRDPISPAPARTGTATTVLTDRAAAWRWLTSEHRVLLGVIGLATDAGFDTPAWQLAWAVNTYLDRLGAWQEQLVVQERALRAASRVADRDGQARAHRNRAVACLRLGDHRQAQVHLRRSLRLYTDLGDAIGGARAHLNLGILAERLGRYAQALQHAQQALDLFAAAENTNGRANALNNIG